MKIFSPARRSSCPAFTLIELLVVIAIIATLAALLIPITHGLKNQRMRRVAYAELAQLETAIESYKSKTGFYPPDNPAKPLTNQLYFELSGTVFNSGNSYTTLDGSGTITIANLSSVFFGTSVNGFANSSTSATGSDDKPAPGNFLKDSHLKPGQVAVWNVAGIDFKVLTCSVGWAGNDPTQSPSGTTLAPWQYRSSNPTNNTTSCDLWVDLLIDNKTNRISNWSKQPQIVP